MPLPKRQVEPICVSRGTIPVDFPLPSELEAATNGTLANTVRQLSSLSRHAEDMFGELAREATNISMRANSLQARIDRLALKVTQLDSNVEEGRVQISLQDILLRKAFKSSTIFDQQVVARDTMPTAMLEIYHSCDKPPPLDKLNPYREDGKDGLKFYTDPNYFFDLWRQEMLKDTERMMHDRGKKPHRPRNDGGGGRHKKRVRQPHNTRERQRQLAVGHGEYIMPQQNMHYRIQQEMTEVIQDETLTTTVVDSYGVVDLSRPPRPNSIELRRSYPEDIPPGMYNQSQSPTEIHYRANYNISYEDAAYQQHFVQGQTYVDGYPTPNNLTPSRGGNGSRRPTQPPPAPPSTNNSNNSTPTVSSANNTPTRGRSMSAGRETLPPPPPPPATENVSSPPPSGINGPLPSHFLSNSGSRSGSPLPNTAPVSYTPEPPPPPPVPPSPPTTIPPPPPPPPPPPMTIPNGSVVKTSSPPLIANGDVCKSPIKQILSSSPPKLSPPKSGDNQVRPKTAINAAPVFDPRSDLLKAIRDGIKLRKVEKIEQKEVDRVNAPHDVASILARRVALEFSDSDSASESEYDSEGWAEQETSA